MSSRLRWTMNNLLILALWPGIIGSAVLKPGSPAAIATAAVAGTLAAAGFLWRRAHRMPGAGR